ncbi:unnamed protein product, partial [Rotaria sp. Silwood2]
MACSLNKDLKSLSHPLTSIDMASTLQQLNLGIN